MSPWASHFGQQFGWQPVTTRTPFPQFLLGFLSEHVSEEDYVHLTLRLVQKRETMGNFKLAEQLVTCFEDPRWRLVNTMKNTCSSALPWTSLSQRTNCSRWISSWTMTQLHWQTVGNCLCVWVFFWNKLNIRNLEAHNRVFQDLSRFTRQISHLIRFFLSGRCLDGPASPGPSRWRCHIACSPWADGGGFGFPNRFSIGFPLITRCGGWYHKLIRMILGGTP